MVNKEEALRALLDSDISVFEKADTLHQYKRFARISNEEAVRRLFLPLYALRSLDPRIRAAWENGGRTDINPLIQFSQKSSSEHPDKQWELWNLPRRKMRAVTDNLEFDTVSLLKRFNSLEESLLQIKTRNLTRTLKEMKVLIENILFVHSLPSNKETEEDIRRRLASHIIPGLSKK